MRIHRNSSVGVIIDVQEKLFPHMQKSEELAKNLSILIDGLLILEVPVLFTEQYRKGLGETIESVSGRIPDFQAVEKIEFSCCDNESFSERLYAEGKRTVILAGIESHVCILQTALDLLEKDYRPVLVADCVASRKERDKELALMRMHSSGVIITSYESILLELCRLAGNDTFKAISKLIK